MNIRQIITDKKISIITIALMTTASPIMFVWINELIMAPNGYDLTNGFAIFDGLRHYHLYMYMMFFWCLLSSFILLYNMDKIIGDKNKYY